MALISRSLGDRARRVRGVATGQVVEGRRRVEEVADEWVRCRLIPQPASEVLDHRRNRIEERGVLVISGDDIRTSDSFDIESRAFGRGLWKVSGTPQIVITRRLGRASAVPVIRLREPTPSEST